MSSQYKKLITFRMKPGLWILILSICLISVALVVNNDKASIEVWELNSLEKIGDHSIELFGDPQIVNTEHGKAMKFDGVNDMLLVDFNPLGGVVEFTVEVVFKPASAYEISNAPRFIHFQDLSDNPADTLNKRVLMELQLNQRNEWWFDGYMFTDKEGLTLANKTLAHPVDKWAHAAITYEDNTFRTFINGVEETNGKVIFNEKLMNTEGKTSIGARMDKRNYYCGLIKTLKITQKALEPQQFIHNYN